MNKLGSDVYKRCLLDLRNLGQISFVLPLELAQVLPLVFCYKFEQLSEVSK